MGIPICNLSYPQANTHIQRFDAAHTRLDKKDSLYAFFKRNGNLKTVSSENIKIVRVILKSILQMRQPFLCFDASRTYYVTRQYGVHLFHYLSLGCICY